MFENAVALDPDFALAYAARPTCARCTTTSTAATPAWMERAKAAAERATALGPGLPEVAVAQAWVLYAGGHLDDAINIVKQAIARKPDCEGGYYLLGRALFSTGRYQELADIADAAIEASGEDYNVFAPIRTRSARSARPKRCATCGSGACRRSKRTCARCPRTCARA